MNEILETQLKAMLSKVGIEDVSFMVNIHEALLKGNPIPIANYYDLVGLNREKADALLEMLGECNENNQITAFSGLSLTPTPYKFIVQNKTLYTWCALDAILFTEWLDVSSQIISHDPIDNAAIELNIEGDHLMSTDPYPLYISLVDTMDNCNIKGSFCNHVSFWASEQTANQWLKDNPTGKIVTIDDFFESHKIGLKCC
tara:strand:+ start:2651 stop:3250 length:600 start_codon:yes stop_codon:yes gene_type:complete